MFNLERGMLQKGPYSGNSFMYTRLDVERGPLFSDKEHGEYRNITHPRNLFTYLFYNQLHRHRRRRRHYRHTNQQQPRDRFNRRRRRHRHRHRHHLVVYDNRHKITRVSSSSAASITVITTWIIPREPLLSPTPLHEESFLAPTSRASVHSRLIDSRLQIFVNATVLRLPG